MSTKKFLYTMAAVYVIGAVVGIAIFKSPSYSKAYLDKYGHEHERRHKIMKNEEYKAYAERPHLYKAGAKLIADAEFVKAYESRLEFQAEQRRIFRYTMYFKVMNSTIFILLLGFALKKPTLDFLDRQIVEIRAGLDNAERARKEASQAKSVASGKMGKWEDTAKGIRKETDRVIEQQLREIHKEFEDAKVQLDKEEQDRRLAEELRAARTIKEDLVNQAVATLEQRYKTESTQARLTVSVDSFVRFMERLR